MADHTRVRGRTGLALILTMLMLFATACKSTTGSDSSSSSSGGTSAVASGSSASDDSSSKPCGTPPCARYVSRGDTKTLSSTLSDHPVLSTVALHVAVSVLCGGVLCLLGEGISVEYVNRAAKDAVAQHACLKVSILPDSDKWKLVSLSPSNQSPYCTD